MMKLDISKQVATVVKFNPRSEKHGEEREPAADLRVRFDVQNDFLVQLDPTLRSFLFLKDPRADGDLADRGTEYSALRMPWLGSPLKWEMEMEPALVLVEPKGERVVLEIPAARLNAIAFEPREGGTVTVSMRVQFHPTEAQAGKLALLDQTEVLFSVSEDDGVREDGG